MQYCEAYNILDRLFFVKTASLSGATIVTVQGDGYIPGVYLDDYEVYHVPGDAAKAPVTKNGVTVMTIPEGSKRFNFDHRLVGMYLGREGIQNVIRLIRYRSYGSLPSTTAWVLPAYTGNLVSGYLAPPAIYGYRIRPAAVARFTIDITASEPATVTFRILNAGGAEVGKNTLKIESGTQKIVVRVPLPPSVGYLMVDPDKVGSRGLSVESVSSYPVSF